MTVTLLQKIYEAIKEWVYLRYGINPEDTVRPFWPGADYKSFDYSEDSIVLDNPPFSILSQICEYYLEHGIRFFLFAPSLTILSSRKTWDKMNHLICDCSIIYENGANVKTSFVTNLDKDVIAQTCPELTRIVNNVSERLRKKKVRELPKYEYPDHIVTAAMMQKLARWEVDFEVKRKDCEHISQLDAQIPERKEFLVQDCFCPRKQRQRKQRQRKQRQRKTAEENSEEESQHGYIPIIPEGT